MKKNTKITLGLTAVLFGIFALSSCTRSFCSVNDQAHMLYAIDSGVTTYTSDPNDTPLPGFTNIYYKSEIKEGSTLANIYAGAETSNIKVPSLKYWHTFDVEVLKLALGSVDYSTVTLEQCNEALKENGYLKYADSRTEKKKDVLWTNWDAINAKVRLNEDLTIDECAGIDFISGYKSSMDRTIANNRSCLAVKDGYYGNYGPDGDKASVFIEGKTWGDAWKKGFFEGLLVYPIGWLVDSLCGSFLDSGVASGVAQFLSILIVTFIVRGIMMVATIKQTQSTAKMQELQPELTKIQNKYPNSNTNNYEKQKLAEETQKLYKKHGINPFTAIIVMIVQFPVFICVWGALQGSAWLSSGSFLGLHLSDSISSVLFKGSNWANPASGVWTALVLFILMAGAQVVSMLLPQWLQKIDTKKVAKLGVNPAQNQSQSTMKMFTYVMMIMIVIMGFSLASAMGVYWLVGAIFSIIQTLVMRALRKNKKAKR